jgi:hypothetical protein
MVDFTVSRHAEAALLERGISRGALSALLESPPQRLQGRDGLWVYQALQRDVGGQEYVLRALVDEGRSPLHVVTVYRSSRVSKYWR